MVKVRIKPRSVALKVDVFTARPTRGSTGYRGRRREGRGGDGETHLVVSSLLVKAAMCLVPLLLQLVL